jgi:hypothetical protein
MKLRKITIKEASYQASDIPRKFTVVLDLDKDKDFEGLTSCDLFLLKNLKSQCFQVYHSLFFLKHLKFVVVKSPLKLPHSKIVIAIIIRNYNII